MDFNCECEIKIVDVSKNDAKGFTQINPYCVRLNSVIKVIKSLGSDKVWYEMTRTTDPIYYFKYLLFETQAFSDDTLLKISLGEIKIHDLTFGDMASCHLPKVTIIEVRGEMTALEIEDKIQSLKPENLFSNLKDQMIETTHIFNIDYEKIDSSFTCFYGDFITYTHDKLTFNEALEMFKRNKGQYINTLQYAKNREYEENELCGLSDDEILARLLL